MHQATFSFIGAGNMASCLIAGLVTAGIKPAKLWVSNPTSEKLEGLKTKFGLHITQDNQTAAQHADALILAVKPAQLKKVALELASIIKERQLLVITVAAGIRITDLNRWLGGHAAIVRCMPNTPAMIQAGATALYANPLVSLAQKSLAESILRAVGITVWVDHEKQLDTVTALSGSGPAYFFLILEAFEQAAIELGLPKDTAHTLTLQTALGAAQMALVSDESLAQLRQRVTSPGGTTEHGLQALQSGNIHAVLAQTLLAAKLRAEELAKLFGE